MGMSRNRQTLPARSAGPEGTIRRHAPLQGTRRRPTSDQAGRGRQDRDGHDPGLGQGSGRGQGRPQDHQPVRRAPRALHARLPDGLPGPKLPRHHQPGRDHLPVSGRSGRPRSVRGGGNHARGGGQGGRGARAERSPVPPAPHRPPGAPGSAGRPRGRRGILPALAPFPVGVPPKPLGMRGVWPARSRPVRQRAGRSGVPFLRRARRGPGLTRGSRAPCGARRRRARQGGRRDGRSVRAERSSRVAVRVRRVPPGAADEEPSHPGPEPGAVSTYLTDIDRDRVPVHIGIVMDGNGRWATQRGLPRTEGHAAGEQAMWDTVQGGVEVGLGWLTMFAFSTENWNRPKAEVRYLMEFNRGLLRRRRDELNDMNVRVRFLGRRDWRVPRSVLKEMEVSEELTAANTGMTLTIAFNYGGRMEIADAVKRLIADHDAGRLDGRKLTPESIASRLYHPD